MGTRALMMFTCLSLRWMVDGFVLHVSEDAQPGTTISGLRRRASCALDQILLPRSADGFLRSESGALALFSRPDCRALRSNPFSVFTLEDCAGNASDFRHLISSRYDLHVHGRNCAIRRTRRRETRDVEIISLRNLTECRAAGSALLRLSDVIPGHLPRCSVSGTSVLRYTRGRLFTSAPLCFTRDSLLEFHLRCVGRDGGVVRVHWRAGSGAFTQTHLKELLERAASSDSGLLNRRKRGINNNPQFLPPMYQVSVAENQPAGTFVVLLKASDPDEGEAGRLEYSLEALFDSRSDNLFSADPASGLVTTLDILDRETKDTHVFRVTAVDHGSPRRTAMATLTVTVSDTNDHEPVFEHQNYRESVRENLEIGYEVLTVRATDGDAPVNGNILYHLTTSNQSKEAFEIDSRSGVIRTRGLVDRETADAYVLLVEANDQGRDPGARSATATVYITVEDDNDNAPQFSEKRYVVQVPEDRPPNTEILQVSASDQDRGNNAMVHFSIMSGNTRGQFYIDAQTGKLDLVSQLDYEMNKEYTLRIRAQDGGRPPLSNISGLVTVQVLDVNDNAPIFVSTPFQATVLENVPIGYSVIHIQAVDADAGDNSRLQYHLTETTPNFPFTINNSTGWIVVASQLDRETLDFYTFGVEARDHGSPPMSSSASISMTILDVNDNNPEFTQQAYYMRLNEDAAVGMSVVTVSALDQDINSVVTYQITTGNTRNRFSITSQSGGGLISLALPLDYKLERQFVLTVMASDGTRFDTAKVYVNVTDANTHRPVFQSSHYTVNINEDRAVGTTVVLISATDEDTGENARISYFMDDSIPQFSIDPDNGAVTTQMELDYEDHVSYTLAITARDNGIPQKSDTTYLEILINDVNDNSPLFLRDRYQGSVTEDIPVYTSVLQVSATDRDSGLNGRVFYTFQGGEDGDGDFIIESTSGIVRTLRRLDRENTPFYNLQAFAVDKGVPALKRPVEIQVTILDVNDNPPVFEKDEFDIFVEENVPIGLVVAHISASDPDEGTNAQVMYQIVEGNIPEIFQLDIFTGELTALTDLDYESRPEYVIVVQATSAPLVSRATVHIKVLDKNDNPPVLKDFQIIFNNYVTDKTNSFPDGVIGRIPAYDPDVSDQLHYTFESGNELNLVILNRSSGEIRLSRALDNNRPLEAPMKISVSDGRHSVRSQCVLQVRVITDELLSNSITLRLLNTSEENFLSEVLSRFLEGVARVLSVGLDDVLLFNVREDTDVSSGVLNVSLTVSGTLEPEELQERLYLKRGLLTHVSAQNVLPFDDNICLREPCENYMKCVSVLRFDSLAPFVASNSVLFRPIRPITGLRCRCPRGFTGDFCETEIDLCYSKPCGAHGVCLAREGGFTCRCLQDYTGERCEVSSRSGRCVEGVCKNGGTCVNLLVGGFRCECPSGAFEKPFCVMSSRNFPPGSFITFRGLRQRFHFTITLTFVTQDSDALLLYNGRFNQKHDFIALEIVEQQLQLSFSAGETRTTVGVYLKGGVSDGQWHTAHIHYYNKASLSRGGVPQGPSDQKIAVLTVDECDSAMSLHFGRAINYSCSAQSSQSGTKKSLDLTGPLLLGGVPRLPDEFPVRSRRFSGCMKDLHIDGRAIDMASFIANNGTLAGCSVKQHFCSTQPCVNGGRCRDLWGSYSCECPLGTGGQHCQTIMPNPLRFQGNGVLSWNDVAAVVTLPWHLEFMFRTRQATSTILHINTVQQHNITVQLRGGRVLMSLQRGEDAALSRVDDVTLDDGQWHHVLLDLRGATGVVTATLTLDHGLYTVWMELDWRLSGVRMKSVSVGGVSSDGKVTFNGFIGCVQGLRMGEWFPSMHQSVGVNVETGCRVPDPCASSPCPRHSRCTDLWDAHTCSCLPGHYGNNCTHACDLNPCLHQSTCSRASGSTHGYVCSCTAGFSGQYCERRADLPCPRGWWGEKSCGPCNCDTSKGFDSDCNKTSGTCRCKDNHYLAPGAEVCVLCDCYHMGSFSRVCDRSSGQCQCKSGVIGRQCDRCDNPFAEVSSSGCEVIYDSCPQVMEGGIWWPRTRFGLPVVVSCPKGSIGAAIRHCDEHRGWMSPDLFNCSGSAFTNLSRLVGRVEREGVQRAIEQLYNVTTAAREFYGSDVRLAYQLMKLVLQHESRQHGFNLTATQHVLFNQHLMQVGSALLAVGNRAHWQHIQQTEAGSAELMWWMEQYINNLAQNMRKTYLSPFIIITPNIVVSVERLEKAGFSGATLPRYKSVRGWRPGNHDTSVTLPDSVFIPRPEVRGQHGELTAARGNLTVGRRRREEEPEEEPEAIASIIIYYSLPSLLPHSYDPDKRSLRVPKRPVINTPVVSISLHAHQMQDILHDPITVQFRLMTSHERSKPTCVHWNHSILAAGVGGWSSKGCEMVFRNRTHISCQCYHMTSFAVLMDVSHRENGEVLPVRLLTWSCVCVTLGFLALTVLFLSCVPAARSNHANITKHSAIALFTAHLLFILGINQADSPFVCSVMAILQHFFWLCVFSWMFLEALHTYRRLLEPRDLDHGAMHFYFLLGWGIPAIITGLAVGLDPEGYGNPDFCSLSLYDTLVWSLAGPVALVLTVSFSLYFLSLKASVSIAQRSCEKRTTAAACALLLLVTVTCVLSLLSVNFDLILLHQLFAAACCLQGPCVFLLRVAFNRNVRDVLRHCCSGKRSNHLIKTKPSAFVCSDTHLYHLPLGESSASLNVTQKYSLSLRDDVNGSKTNLNEHETLFQDKEKIHDSDSDTDLSEGDHSGSFSSTHSSDSEGDEGEIPQEECWENLVTSNNHQEQSVVTWPVKAEESVNQPETQETENLLLLLPSTQLQRGILKKPLSPISERNTINRFHKPPPISPTGSASSRVTRHQLTEPDSSQSE